MNCKLILILTLFTFFSIFPVNANANENKAVRIGVFYGIPWSSLSDDKNNSGIVPRFWQKVAQRSGLNLEMSIVPYKRMLLALQFGDIDYAIFFKSAKSQEIAYPVLRITGLATIILTHHEGKEHVFEDLYALKIAAKRGVLYHERFDRDPRINKIELTDYDRVIKLFQVKRADAMVGSAVSLGFHMAKNNIDRTKISKPYVLKENQVFLHLSKAHRLSEQNRQQIENTISALIQEDYYGQLLKQVTESLDEPS